MKTEVTDEKLAALIREVQARKKANPPVPKPTWRDAFGMMPDDELSQEAARLGEEWRRSEGTSE